MNKAELEFVLEAIKSLSGDASTAFQWWIAAKYGSGILGGLFIGLTVIAITFIVSWAILKYQAADHLDDDKRRIAEEKHDIMKQKELEIRYGK